MVDNLDHVDMLERLARIETREEERLRHVEQRWQEHRREHAEVKATLGEIRIILRTLTSNHNGQMLRERVTWAGGGVSVPIVGGAIAKLLGWF